MSTFAWRLGAAALATSIVAAVSASPAFAAAAPPTITSAFTPALIGAGGSSALSVTITNPNTSGTLSAVAFTDTLPSGLTVDDPSGESGTCGSAGLISAVAGSQTVSLSAGSLKATTSCTISVSVTAAAAGTFQNTPGPVTSSAGAGAAGAVQTLTVLEAPTVTVSGLTANAKIPYGKRVSVTYTCAQPDAPADLADCSAADDLGNAILSGGTITTNDAGPHSLTVSATSTDGLVTADTINYTILPDNAFKVTAAKGAAHGALNVALALPGPGKIRITVFAGKVAYGSETVSAGASGKLKAAVKATKAGAALIAGGATVKVKLEVAFTPKGGTKRTVTKRGVKVSSAG